MVRSVGSSTTSSTSSSTTHRLSRRMHACFSISAPQLTEKEQEEELEALTEEERLQIQNDVNGTARFMETEEMVTRGLIEFENQVELIPAQQKEAYLEAVQRVPHLVETETNPIKFLRCEHFDAKKAAQRMVRNWEMRRTIFKELAFEPMTLDGALCNDTQTLRTGFFQLLQSGSSRQDENRAIFLFDRPKLLYSYNRESAVRCMFYVFHVASHDDSAAFTQRNGAILLVDALQYRMQHFDRKLCKRLYQLLQECTCLQLSAVHVCTVQSRSTYTLIMPCVLALMGRHNRLRTVIHARPLYVEELTKCGLTVATIPTALGGEYSLTEFQAWIQQQRAKEKEKNNKDDGNSSPTTVVL